MTADPATDEPTAIRASRGIYDPHTGDFGRPVAVFEGDRVAELRDDVPADAELLFDHDGYALPGLVDAHTHATIRPGEGDQLSQLGADRVVATVRSVNNLRRDLAAGTTTARLMAEEGYLDVRLAEMEQAGELASPRLLPSGVHLTPTDGHGMVHTATDGPAEIRQRIRENVRQGAYHTKFFATGGVSSDTGSPGRSQYTREEVRAIVDETHRHEMQVSTHAHGGDGAIVAIEEGVDTVEHASRFGDEEIDLLEGTEQYAVGNFAISQHPSGIEAGDGDNPAIMAKLRESRTVAEDAWRSILAADVNVAVGTDSMHGFMHYEMAKLAEYGAAPADALNAGTLWAAEACWLDDEVGSVEPGKRADVVFVEGNPLEDVGSVADVAAVVKDGEVVA